MQMRKYSSKLLSISVIVLLALVPVIQALPLNLPPLLPSAAATGGITLNSVSSNSSKLTASPFQITLASFNAGTGSNRLLVVGIEANNQSVSSVTFGGVALSQATGSFHNDYTAFWSLKNPNGTAKIVVTMGGSTGVVIGAYAFSGVDQTNPIPTTATFYRSSGNPTISLNTLYANSVVLDSPAIWGGVTLGSPTCTKQWNATVTTNQVSGASSNKTQTTPGAVTCGWTASGTGNGWDDSAIEVKASGAASATTPIVLNSKSTTAGNGVSSPFKITMYKFSPGTSSNRLLVVGVTASSKSATSVKFGTTSLTQAVSSFNNNDAEFWYLKNPSSTPADLVVTMSGNTPFVVGTYSFSGVDQTTPIPTTAVNNNTASSSPTISITAAYANSTVLDLPSIYGGATLSSPTCTQQWDANLPSGITGASSNKTMSTAGQVTCSWTASSGELWDDAAVEIKASTSKSSHTANTGILIPLYVYPSGGGATWRSVNNTKGNYTQVPIFAIANPDSGPCDNFPTSCNSISDYQNAINGQIKSGVIVVGYVWSNPDPAFFNPQTTSEVESNITAWISNYPNIQGIFLDGMPNGISGYENFYKTITNYIHNTKHLAFSFGNPGADTLQSYNGTVDNLTIFETDSLPSISPDLKGIPAYDSVNHNKSWHEYYDKSKFSFISWNQTATNGGLPNNATLGNYSNYVGFMYITDNPGCGGTHPCDPNTANPYNTTSSYLMSLAKALNHNSTTLTFNAINSTGNYLKGLYVNATQSSNWIPSGNTTLNYNATTGIRYTFTMEPSQNCIFAHWVDTGSTNPSRTMTANATNAAFVAAYKNNGAQICK